MMRQHGTGCTTRLRLDFAGCFSYNERRCVTFMNPSRHTLISMGLVFASLAPIWAQGTYGATRATVSAGQPASSSRKVTDPGELYLTAYRLCRESEELASRQSYNAAIKRGMQAERVLAGIVRDFPQWKPNMVAARRKLLAENMNSYREKARESRIPTGRQPGSPVSTEVPSADRPVLVDNNYQPIELPDYESTDKRLYNALALAQEECRRMAAAYKDLSQKYDEVQKKLSVSEVEGQMYKSRYDALQKQIASERQAGNRLVDSLSRQLSEMEARYRASEQAREEAEKRVAELESQLASTQAELERVTRERDALRAENEQLRAIVELNSPEKTKALFDQNLTLSSQLKEAQARVADLEARLSGSSDQNTVLANQLQEARNEANRLRDEMGGLYEESLGYRRRVSDLSGQLNNLEADLKAQAERPVVDPALVEENRLLRQVIEKQRRTLAMQEEGRKLLVETYKQLKNPTAEQLAAIKKLEDESSLDLTDADKQVIEAVRKQEPGTDAVRQSLQVETLADMAAKAFTKGRYTAAEQFYRTLYDYHPDHVAGLVNLGTILLYRNKCDEALEYLTRATRLAPDLAISYFQSGVALYRLNRLDEARIMFQRTIELDPANAEAFFYLANIEGVSGQFDKALNYYAAAVKLNPALGDAHYNMARLYAEKGRIADAARAYDRAIHSGAEPDPEFEQYLRDHPDSSQAAGEDLLQTVKPEDEAARLRAEDTELQKLIDGAPEGQGSPEPGQQDAASADSASPEAVPTEPAPEDPNPTEVAPPAPPPADPDSEQPAPDATTGDTETGATSTGSADAGEAAAAGNAAEENAPQGAADDAWPKPPANPSRGYDASLAGKGHELSKERFRTKRVRARVDGRRRTIKLRMKLPEPKRLRDTRDGSYQNLKSTGKKKR